MLFPSQQIADISWRRFCLPFRQPYVTSAGQSSFRHGLVLFVRTNAGLRGIGEASPVGPGALGQVETIVASLAAARRNLVGQDLVSLTDAAFSPELPACLRFGLETAWLDIQGQIRGCSLSEVLGGMPSRLPCNALITASSPAEAETQTRQAVSQGFAALKLKIGGASLLEDEAMVSGVRQAAGQAAKLRLDPNQSWGVAQAIDSIRLLAQYDIDFVEQPVKAGDIEGLAAVRRSVPVPIAADESLDSLASLRRILAVEAADVFILKAAQIGQISATLEIAREALAHGGHVVVTTSLESGIGLAASAHIASALPATGMAHGLATGLLFQSDLISPPLLPEGGYLATPAGPGLGVRLPSEMLEPPG